MPSETVVPQAPEQMAEVLADNKTEPSPWKQPDDGSPVPTEPGVPDPNNSDFLVFSNGSAEM